MGKIILGISSILTAFDEFGTVGTKVTSGAGEFQNLLAQEIKKLSEEEGHELKHPKFFDMPTDAYHLVRCGVARREGLTEKDKHYREVRGDDDVYAYPKFALPKVESLAVLVFPVDIYFGDPEVTNGEKAAHVDAGTTHVMVAVHGGPASLSYIRLVNNLAGGSNLFLPHTEVVEGTDITKTNTEEQIRHDLVLLHEVIKEAKDTKEYERKYIRVAEPKPLSHEERNRLGL